MMNKIFPETEPASNSAVSGGPASPRVSEINTEIRRVVGSQRTSGSLLRALLDLTMRRPDAMGIACFLRDGAELKLGPHKVRQPRWQASLDTKPVVIGCVTAIKSRMLQVVAVEGLEPATAICIPTQIGDVRAIAFLISGSVGSDAMSGEIVIAEMLLSHLRGWQDRVQVGQLTKDLNATAATLELVRRVEASDNVVAASCHVASALKDHLKCEQVAVGLRTKGKSCRVTAISGVADVDDNAVLTRRLKAVLDESVVRGETSAWPPLPNSSSHQLMAHKQLARRDESVISVPLRNFEGETVGALVLRGSRDLASLPDVCNFVETLDEPLGSAIQAVHKMQGTWASRLARSLLTPQHGRKRLTAMLIAFVVVAAMTIPATYRIPCRSLVEPTQRRFCVAPHEGLLAQTWAEPGDVVSRGQRLADMDGREIRLELASIAAEIHRAEKQRDSLVAQHKIAESVMAELEIETLTNRANLLRLRESGLKVASPIDGVVLSGSLDRRENYPVTKGQILYEIAPLHPLRIEVGVPAEDVPHVAVGMLTRVRFDGLEGESFQARVSAIRPRSEVRNGRNVFVAEVEVDNRDGRIRPGMEGRAKIESHAKSIGWILFHRAWERIRTAWPF